MDEFVVGGISIVVICIIALAFLLAPCGNLMCYTTECADCEAGEVHLTRALQSYQEDYGVEDTEARGWGLAALNTPGLRLIFVLAPILIPAILLLYFFFFTDAGHMLLGIGMVLIGIIIMLIAAFAPFLYRILMPIGAIFFTMGVVMFTFS